MDKEPELHVVGEIKGGVGFDTDNAFCAYRIEKGKYWECVGGKETGQTQVDYTSESSCVWNHPIDLHYFTKANQGWPAFVFEVWSLDSTGGKVLGGYGTCHIPTTPGKHEIKCPIWRPSGTPSEEVMAYFVGPRPELVEKDAIYKNAGETRSRLFTKTSGYVKLALGVITRHMNK